MDISDLVFLKICRKCASIYSLFRRWAVIPHRIGA